MHAIMNDTQLSNLANVFNPEMFQIRTRSIEMPPQLAFKWKEVAVSFISQEFLQNIEKYKYNQFLKIGKLSNSLSGANCTLLFRQIPQLLIPVQGDSGHY